MSKPTSLSSAANSVALFSLVASICLSSSIYAQSGFEPIFESLDYRQQQQYISDAPSGNDEPLAEPGIPLQTVNRAIAVAESVLEDIANEEQGPISLEESIETQISITDLEQYGYDLFSSAPTTFAQVEDLPVPGDYIVGPGDSIIVQLYGGRNVEYNLVVTREGQLLLPELGPLEVSGLTFEELKFSISNFYAEQVIGAQVVVSMNQLRSIQVRLTGEVKHPGAYTVSGLATLVDALLSTGGVKHSGSLRNIQLKRGGQTISRLDLYDLLMSGDTSDDSSLKHNDVIYVPPIGDVVYLGGEVQRPAIYELKNENTLPQVIALAGGLLANASIEASHIERIVSRRYRTLIDLSSYFSYESSADQIPNIPVQAGDFVRILPVAETMDDVILLSGHVKRPGGYQLRSGTRISDLILDRDQILSNTDLDFALLIREQAGTRRTEIDFVDLTAAITNPGSESDLVLRPRDELRLFNLQPARAQGLNSLIAELDLQGTDYRPSKTAAVLGFARFTGRFPLKDNVRLLDFLRVSGGISQGVDMNYLVIARVGFPDGNVSMKSYSLDSAIRSPWTDQNPVILPGDRIYLFDDELDRSALMESDLDALAEQASYTDQELIVRANGLVAHPGRYPLEDNMRASDLVCAAGGLSVTAFGLEAELSRYDIVGGDERNLHHRLLSSEDLIGLCKEQAAVSSQTLELRRQIDLEEYGRISIEDGRREVTDIIEPVYFDSGDSRLLTDEIERLRDAIRYYKSVSQDVQLVFTGHTDSIPLSAATRDKYGSNQGLSVARAIEVAEQIAIALGLNREDYEVRGEGSSQPIASNDSVYGRSLNRRTEIKLILGDDRSLQPSVVSAFDLPLAEQTAVDQVQLDTESNPFLRPHDQLTFVTKPNWIEKSMVELTGEVTRPGLYVIDRGETLCEVMERAGGVTQDAYVFGAQLSRESIREMQQKTLDGIQDQLDDILIELSMSHSARNDEKTPAGDSKDEYLQIIRQLDRAEANGRLVIDLEEILDCKRSAQVALEDGDVLHVPRRPSYVNVAGQVYVPTSHMYRDDRDAEDYIELSGGATVIGRVTHSYIIQANGEVMSYSGRRSSNRITEDEIQPGAEIIVPLDLDRMNLTERVQSWTRSLMETALFAGLLL